MAPGARLSMKSRKLCKWQALHDAGDHGLMDLASFAELSLALRIFARSEMAQTRFAAEDLASSGHFEALGNGFLRLATCDRSWHGAGKVAGEAKSASTLFDPFRIPDREINLKAQPAAPVSVPGERKQA